MVDFVLGVYFTGLFVRGWLRGFVKEAMDLIGLIVGAFVAFRYSRSLGEIFESMSQTGPTVARYVAGIVLFLVVGSLAAIGAHYLGKVAYRPGFKTSNRLFGALAATSWGWLLATVIIMLSTVLPLRGGFDEAFEKSVIVGTITNPEGVTQRTVRAVAGDRLFSQVMALEDLFGDQQVILEPGQSIVLDPVPAEDLTIDDTSARRIFELVNDSRIEAGLTPLVWSDALSSVGLAHAREMYVEGYFSHESPRTGTVGDRVTAAGISYVIVGENLALAADAIQVHEGLMDSPSHRENILRPQFRRLGIGVVDGPTGLMVVQVFSG